MARNKNIFEPQIGYSPEGFFVAPGPLNAPPTHNYCDMSGVQMSPLRAMTVLMKGFKFAAVNMSNQDEAAAAQVKKQLLGDVATMALGLSASEGSPLQGFIRTTGTETNGAAINYARKMTSREGVVCSSLSHRSVSLAAGKGVRKVPVNPETYQMNEGKLLNALTKEVAVLVVTAGLTELGIIEKIPAAVEARCKELGIRIHVDAAFGGMNLGMLPSEYAEHHHLRQVVQSPGVDSIMVDTHKFVGPQVCSLLFLPKGGGNNEDMYIPGATELSGSTQGTFIPYLVLETMREYGKKGLQEAAKQTYDAARYFGRCLKYYGIETIIPVQSGIIPIKLNSKEEAAFVHAELKKVGLIIADPLAIPTTESTVHGIRLVFTSKTFFDFISSENLAGFIAGIVGFYRKINFPKNHKNDTIGP